MNSSAASATAFVVLWSSGYIGAVLAEPAGSTAGLLAWRYVVTAAVLVIVVVALRRVRRISARELWQQAVLAVLAHVVFLGGVFGATAMDVDAGTVALVCALQPMLVTVAGRIGWGDRVRLRQSVGLAVGVVAVAISAGVGATGGAAVLLPVASLLGLSGAALLERRWEPSVDAVTSLCIQVVCAAACFTLFAVATGRLEIAVTPAVVGAVAWLVLLSGIGGYLAFIVCLRRLGSSTTSVLLYLTPPVTTLWAWAMFGQAPGAAQWVGLALGAVAVLLAWPPRDEVSAAGAR